MIFDLKRRSDHKVFPNIIPKGAAIFCVREKSIHSGIASSDKGLDESITAYEIGNDETSILSEWDPARKGCWHLHVFAYLRDHDTIKVKIVEECMRLAGMTDSRYSTPSREHTKIHVTWKIALPFEYRVDEHLNIITIKGSCASFVHYCYSKAGIDLIDTPSLPYSTPDADEHEDVIKEYKEDGDTIHPMKRLYPSYLIRCFQKDHRQWHAEEKYRFYPIHFYDPE